MKKKIGWGVGMIALRIFLHGKKFQEGSASLDELAYLGHLAAREGVIAIGEIGFNAGFSSFAFLAANPKVNIVSFDLGEHDYVEIAKRYIDKKFPGRHRLIIGDSRVTVPQFKIENPQEHFNLAFVDGGHEYEVAAADIANMKKLCAPKAMVVIDDLTPWLPWGKGPTQAWQEAVRRGEIIEEEMMKDGKVVEKIEPPGKRIWAVGRYVDKNNLG